MKVLLLLDSYAETDSGMMVYRLCQRWEPMRELTVTTISFGEDGPLAERFRNLGIGTRVVSWRGLQSVPRIRELGKKLLWRGDRPDVVHSFCRWPDLSARFFHGGNPYVPLISTVLEVKSPLPLVERGIERLTRRWCSNVVNCSIDMEQRVASHGIPVEKLRLIRMGVDALQCFPLAEASRAHFRKLLGVGVEDPLIIAAAAFDEQSGHAELIEALPEVIQRHPSARLFLIGEGPGRDDLEKRVQVLGLGENVRLISNLTEIMFKVFSTADLVVHLARNETFSLLVAEALATGTPVIALRDGGLPEMLTDGETGVLVNAGDRQGLGRAIIRLLDDPDLRHHMGGMARDRTLERFELGNTVEEYIALWKDRAPDAPWKETDSLPIEDFEAFKRESTQELEV